jgi:hypothetical protein
MTGNIIEQEDGIEYMKNVTAFAEARYARISMFWDIIQKEKVAIMPESIT